jgi:hypothetical protein
MVEPLDTLFVSCNVKEITRLLDAMLQLAKSTKVGVVDSFASSARRSMKYCADLQLYYVFALAASCATCAKHLISYNNNHPRTAAFIQMLAQAFFNSIRTLKLPNEEEMYTAKEECITPITTPILFSLHMRMCYFHLP